MLHAFKTHLSPVLAVFVLAAALAGSAVADSQRCGTFAGRSGHTTSGGVTLTMSGGKTTLTLHGNFRLDGAPDPWIGFGKGGSFVKATRFIKLSSNSGQQVYAVPARIDIDSIDEVYIWCQKFSVPLGVARLR